jgi:hypothetical protein
LQSQALGSSFIMLTEMQAIPIILLTADLKSIQYESGAGEKKIIDTCASPARSQS